MDYFTALKQNINDFIVANGNKEITADILRPILLEICNVIYEKTGDLEFLNTSYKDNLVGAINEVLGTESGLKIHYGTVANPNGATLPPFELGDFYAQQGGGSILSFWQFNGTKWIKIIDPEAVGTGDMQKSTYDPTNKEADVFDFGNMDNVPEFLEDAPNDSKTYGRKGGQWAEIQDTDISGKEDVSNKAVNLSSPNNTKYPTTKAVTDALSGYVPTSRAVNTSPALSGGGNLSSNRTLDLSATTKTDIQKGVTAEGWGNHNTQGYLKSADISGKEDKSNRKTTLANPDDNSYPTTKAVADAIEGSGGGDMMKSVYDPTGKNADAFDFTKLHSVPSFVPTTRQVNTTGSLTGGGNLSSNRTLDLTSAAKSDIQKGVTAHGWGDHSTQGYLKLIDISGKEDKINKVTDLTDPNDTTYPTTKAVDDAIKKSATESDTIKIVAINETAMFYTPINRGNILQASVGSYFIPKTTADKRVIYKGDAKWTIELEQGFSGSQNLILEPEYGNLVLASVEIPVSNTKEYSLEIEYQLEFKGDSQSNVMISGVVKAFSGGSEFFSANIMGVNRSTQIPSIGDRIFKITAETGTTDRVYGALGGSLMKIYSEESGGDDPDPPPSFNLEDFKRNTIHPNFSPVQSTVTMYENIPYGDHPLENFDIFLPNGKNNCPVVIFIHGGGFSSYSKTEGYGPRTGIDQTWQIHEDAMYFLNQDIAYASINYPLIDLQNPEDGPRMKEIFDRIDYCIQFMKYHSSTLRINKNKFILTGISAGPTYAMYSHFSPDRVNPTSSDLIERESPKPFTIAGRYTGVTEDIEIWEDEIFNHIGLDVRAAFNSLPNSQKQMILAQNKALYGFDSLDDFYTLQGKNILNLTNGVRFLNPSIEEFWLANYYTQIANDLQILGHHGLQAKWLHEKADAAGTPHIIFYGDQSHGNETFRNFIVRKMNE